jgi:hypothetical protein
MVTTVRTTILASHAISILLVRGLSSYVHKQFQPLARTTTLASLHKFMTIITKLFPTCLSHSRKCAHSLLNSPSVAPLSFQGFNNRPDRKSQSPVTNAQCTKEQFLAKLSPGKNAHRPYNSLLRHQISHLERMLTSLTTRFFDNKSLNWR